MNGDRLSLDWISATELDAVEFLELAARHELSRVGLFAQPVAMVPELQLDLLGDTQARRETLRTSRDLGITIDMLDVLLVDIDCNPETFLPAFETGALLGARWFTVLCWDRDSNRLTDNLATLSAMAIDHDMRLAIEPSPRTSPRTLVQTALMLDAYELDDIQIEIDSLHFFRCGGKVRDIVNHGGRIARAQLCDGPADMAVEDMPTESRRHRLPPGEGALPLQSFVDALPAAVVIGIEVPNIDIPVEERVARSVAGARRLLHQAPVA